MKKILLTCLVLFPLFGLTQTKEQQELAKQTYLVTITSMDAANPEKRDSYVKLLKGIQSVAEDESTFSKRVEDHQNYLENLSYFEIPIADTAIITDSLVQAYDLSYEKSKGNYYIEPGDSFRPVIKENQTGIYLYIYINERKQTYLEFVNYTNGEEKLQMYKSVIEVGDKKFSYYLNWVKSRGENAEYCSIETNTRNFLELFEALSNHDDEFKITFLGENGNRTQMLPKEMAKEIKSIISLYKLLKDSNTADTDR
ncbi:hypothetical protein ACJD0Z_01230 [Flavobacteriaceae bacterium M23B6Z8]